VTRVPQFHICVLSVLATVGFSGESAMVKNFLQIHDTAGSEKKVLAGVVFDKMPLVQSRMSLSSIEYKLRFPSTLRSVRDSFSLNPFNVNDRWMTQLMFPLTEKVGPRKGNRTQGGPPGK